MPVEVYTDLETIPEETAGKLSVTSGLSFFDSIEWFRCLLAHGIAAGSPRVYVSRDNGVLQSALYCLAQNRTLQSLTNFYTIEYGPVMSGSDAQTGLHDIVSYIAGERPRWSAIDLRNLPENDLQHLVTAFAATAFTTHSWNQTVNWFLELENRNFDQYYDALSSQLRNTLQRKRRKTEREHEIRLAIYPEEGISPTEAISHYETIYAASWKEAEPFPEFMPALIRACDARGLARVGMAWVDGQPAAAQLWIVEKNGDSNRAIIYKLAYDKKFGSLSIGSILSAKMFQHAIDTDRVAEIDYGVGDEPYKRDWMSDCRNLSGLLACNRRTLAGQLRNLREFTGALLRKRK